MHPNTDLIAKFYTAFQARDAESMNACYHPEIVFSDPAFGTLTGNEAASMWQMLCERGKDLDIEFSEVHADDERGSAHWEAWYTFSRSRRRVHNRVDASFTFRDGKIIRHTDRFNLWKWSGMAFGPLGMFLGWTPFMRFAIRKEARRGLEHFILRKS